MLFVQNFLNSGNSLDKKRFLQLFCLGLVVRLILILIFNQQYQKELVDFVDEFLQEPSLDPWKQWIMSGREINSFPYGPSLLLYLVPFFWFGSLIGISSSISYGMALLLGDILLLRTIAYLNKNLFQSENELLKLSIYWLNPLILFVIYTLGLYDIIPVVFLVLTLIYLFEKKTPQSFLFYFFAVLGKSAILITYPFLILFILKRKQYFEIRNILLSGYTLAIILSLLTIFLTDGLFLMLGKSSELDKLFILSTSLGDKTFFWSPILLGILIFHFFRLRVISLKVLFAYFLSAFVIVIISSLSGNGWVIWSSPFFVLLYDKEKYFKLVFFAFLFTYSLQLIIYEYPNLLLSINQNILLLLNKPKGLINTSVFLFGFLYIFLVISKKIKESDPFCINSKPLGIGIAGDSSTGKDSLVLSIERLFSKKSIQHISGDDYHLWDRSKTNWEILTHLNPLANDLDKLANDIYNLRKYSKITKRHYDHSDGKMTKEFIAEQREIVISSGLHTLYIPNADELFDLKIYLKVEKSLRYALKIKRDVTERGRSIENVLNSLIQRERDAVNYIDVQQKKADLIIELKTTQKIDLEQLPELDPKKFILHIVSKGTRNYLKLHKTLVGLLGLNCSMEILDDSRIQLETNCTVSSEQIRLGAKIILKELHQFLDDEPKWEKDSLGIIQLLVLNQLENQRKFNTL